MAAIRNLEQLPALIAKHVLPGAARVGAKVIAQEAKTLLGSRSADAGKGSKQRVLIADSVKIRSRKRDGLIVARVLLEGPGAYVGRWLEYGTSPHFISVDPAFAQGITARRVNKRIADGDGDLRATLTINGKPVGATVYHPGARKAPFLRPALDLKGNEAKAAANAYIRSRVTRAGIVGTDEGDE